MLFFAFLEDMVGIFLIWGDVMGRGDGDGVVWMEMG